MNIDFIKGRTLDNGKEVSIYRNLNVEGVSYSIKQGGLVIGHTQKIDLVNAKFHVSDSGRLRVLDTRIKNVHAYIKGYAIDGGTELAAIKRSSPAIKVTYNPFRDRHFVAVLPDGGIYGTDTRPISSMIVEFSDRGVYCTGLLVGGRE